MSSSGGSQTPPPQKVIVTGAAGRTGRLVYDALQKNPSYQPIGIVRSAKSAKKNKLNGEWIESDIATWSQTATTPTDAILQDAQAMVICTSAVPQLKKAPLLSAMLLAPWRWICRKQVFDSSRDLQFTFKENQTPELIDYHGQVAQVNFAKQLGISRVVLVSSMGGTDPDNFLNRIGKDKDGKGGDILLWKRKAEKYLVESGLEHVIIHPGGLVDTPGGELPLLLNINDILLKQQPRTIPRQDVANLCVAALNCDTTTNSNKKLAVSLDVICDAPNNDKATTIPSADQALKRFLETGQTNNYDIFTEPVPGL